MLGNFIRGTGWMLRNLPSNLRHAYRIWSGSRVFRKTGETPDRAYQSLIRMYCNTNGYSNDLIHYFVKKRRPPQEFPHAHGVLGELSAVDVQQIAKQIRDVGYYISPTRLPNDVVDRMMEFALTQDAPIYPPQGTPPRRGVFDRENPVGATYWFDEQSLTESFDAQKLMADKSILAVVQEYLDCLPALDIVNMWWSTSKRFEDTTHANAGQWYHFDMNRIKWLKVVFYLTDVTTNTGPHCFVKKTHKAGSQPRALLKRGYARISDDDIKNYYRDDELFEITGPAGSIAIVDTRGFHRGKTPVTDERLMFQLNYSDCLFGAECPRLEIKNCQEELYEMAQSYPDIYSRFDVKSRAQRRNDRQAA